jgi:hypothetical protein
MRIKKVYSKLWRKHEFRFDFKNNPFGTYIMTASEAVEAALKILSRFYPWGNWRQYSYKAMLAAEAAL